MTELPKIDAVTAVFTCNSADQLRVFMVKRQPWLNDFPGCDAFPGGKIEASDEATHAGESGVPSKHYGALQRELEEELNWSLNAATTEGSVTAISLLGSTTTPDRVPQKNTTWFYRIHVTQPVEFLVDHNEASSGRWRDVDDWLNEYKKGALLLAPPALAILQGLLNDPQATSLSNVQYRYPTGQVPLIEPLNGLRLLLVRSNTLPPAEHTNCFLLGDSGTDQIIVDPSPANDDELQRLIATIKPFAPTAIFITHHHGDHNERADVLARALNLPLRMSEYTQQRLQETKPAFFDGITVQTCFDGDIQCHWLGQPVHAIAVPGHDEGQMALAPQGQSPAWCIVGDLIQGIGTVIISPPEGDMAQYFRTMQTMIDLNPIIIVPSHGFAMGGTFRLQATLDHRKQRENSILERHQLGENEDQILASLYAGLHPKLMPLARINIQSHQRKLQQEGRWKTTYSNH